MATLLASLRMPARRALSWRSVFVLCVISGVTGAAYKAGDNLIMHTQILAIDRATAASAYLIVGGWLGVACGFVFSLVMGRKIIDPGFVSFSFRSPKLHAYAFIAGLLGALGTFGTLRGNQEVDPGVLAVFAGMTFVMTAVYDVWKKQLELSRFALPALVAIGGCALVSFGGSLSAALTALIWVAVVANPTQALGEVVEQRGTRASDAVNFFVWRFFWLAATGTVLALAVAGFRGYLGLLFKTIGSAVLSAETLFWILMVMFFVFLSIGLKLSAKKPKGTGVSYVSLLVSSVQILLFVPITFVADRARPGLFGPIPSDPLVWVVRVLG